MFESSVEVVVVQELGLAIKCALYVFCEVNVMYNIMYEVSLCLR